MVSQLNIEFAVSDHVDGREIGPGAVPLGLLKDFAEEVQAFIRGSDAETDAAKLAITIVSGSLAFRSVDPLPVDLAVWRDIDSLSRGSIDNVDPRRAEIALKWQRKSAKHPTRKVRAGDPSRVHFLSIDSSTVFRSDEKKFWVTAERYLSGTLEDLGGQTPNLHLRLDNGRLLLLDATRDQILGEERNLVYHPVVVRVAMEENTLSGEIRNARFLGFAEYSPRIDEAQYRKAIEAGRSAWADVDDPAAWVRDIRGDEH
jgi:hypothetical protein